MWWAQSAPLHTVLLKHYYSVDFPWWFDRKIFFSFYSKSKWKNLSNDRNSKLHFAIWQKNCFRWILSASNQSGSQNHAWILLKKKIYYIRIYSIFCRASPFYREWLPLINILMIETFSQKANQNLSTLWPIEAIHSEKDLPCKKIE